MKILFLILISITAQAGNTVGNGGDSLVVEFTQIARTSLHYLDSASLSQPEAKIVLQLKQSLLKVQVNSAETLILNGVEVDAINYPLENKILVSRARWSQAKLRSPLVQAIFVLHEYLGVSGYDDSRYQISQILAEQIEHQLHENYISASQVESFLGIFISHALLFHQELALPDLSIQNFCSLSGLIDADVNMINSIISNHLFWFTDSKSIEMRIDTLKLHQQALTDSCFNNAINPVQDRKRLHHMVDVMKSILMEIQFPTGSKR